MPRRTKRHLRPLREHDAGEVDVKPGPSRINMAYGLPGSTERAFSDVLVNAGAKYGTPENFGKVLGVFGTLMGVPAPISRKGGKYKGKALGNYARSQAAKHDKEVSQYDAQSARGAPAGRASTPGPPEGWSPDEDMYGTLQGMGFVP